MSHHHGLPIHLLDLSNSVPNDTPAPMPTDQAHGDQQAIQARSTVYYANQNHVGNPRDNGYQGYQGYQDYYNYHGYKGIHGCEGIQGYNRPIPETFHHNPLNGVPSNAGWGYSIGLGQASGTDDWLLQFMLSVPIVIAERSSRPGMNVNTAPIYPTGHQMIGNRDTDPGRPDEKMNDWYDASPALLAAVDLCRSVLPPNRGTEPGAPSPRTENKLTKHWINPEAPPFVPSMAAGKAQGDSLANSDNSSRGRVYRYGQATVARPPTDLEEYAKKLERWIGMEDDDEFVYFEEDPVFKKADETQSTR